MRRPVYLIGRWEGRYSGVLLDHHTSGRLDRFSVDLGEARILDASVARGERPPLSETTGYRIPSLRDVRITLSPPYESVGPDTFFCEDVTEIEIASIRLQEVWREGAEVRGSMYGEVSAILTFEELPDPVVPSDPPLPETPPNNAAPLVPRAEDVRFLPDVVLPPEALEDDLTTRATTGHAMAGSTPRDGGGPGGYAPWWGRSWQRAGAGWRRGGRLGQWSKGWGHWPGGSLVWPAIEGFHRYGCLELLGGIVLLAATLAMLQNLLVPTTVPASRGSFAAACVCAFALACIIRVALGGDGHERMMRSPMGGLVRATMLWLFVTVLFWDSVTILAIGLILLVLYGVSIDGRRSSASRE